MKNNRIFVTIGLIIGFMLLYFFVSDYLNLSSPEKTREYYQVLSLMEEGKVTQAKFQGAYKLTYVLDGKEYSVYTPGRTAFDNDLGKVRERMADDKVNNLIVEFDNPDSGAIFGTLLTVALVIVVVGTVYFLFKQMNGANNQAFTFGKTRAKNAVGVKVKFGDVAGAEEEKEELKEIVEFLKTPQKFTTLGARIPKGVLLIGPPGTGKTLLAKAVAGEAGVPFFSVSGSDFVEMFVGVGASRVRDLFDVAKKNMPCIVFIDEIDAVGRQRGTGLGGGHDEREQTLNQLLVHLDGFEPSDGIIVMAATNRADVLDPALLRPGRFDRQIYVPIPDVRGREAIFKIHARNKPLADDVNYQTLSRITSGFSGAEIENLLNEAAILAARNNHTKITMHDINEGINKVIIGPQKKSRLITEADKRITALHESGHAILAKLLKTGEVHEVSIIPRGMAAGYTLTNPENDESHISKSKLLDGIVMTLGGRAAEAVMIKEISTGAQNDIQRITATAHSMVAEWGMSDAVGTVYLGSEHDVFIGRDFQAQHRYSEEMAAKLDAETKKIIDACYAKALELLTKHKSVIEHMARVLIERETIYSKEVDMLVEGAHADAVLAYIAERDAAKDSAVAPVEAGEDKK